MWYESTGRKECLPTFFAFTYLLRVLSMFSRFVFNVTFHSLVRDEPLMTVFSYALHSHGFKSGVFPFILRVVIRLKFSPKELMSLLLQSFSIIGLNFFPWLFSCSSMSWWSGRFATTDAKFLMFSNITSLWSFFCEESSKSHSSQVKFTATSSKANESTLFCYRDN